MPSLAASTSRPSRPGRARPSCRTRGRVGRKLFSANQSIVVGVAGQHRAVRRRAAHAGRAHLRPDDAVHQRGLPGAGGADQGDEDRRGGPAHPGQQVVVDLAEELAAFGLGLGGTGDLEDERDRGDPLPEVEQGGLEQARVNPDVRLSGGPGPDRGDGRGVNGLRGNGGLGLGRAARGSEGAGLAGSGRDGRELLSHGPGLRGLGLRRARAARTRAGRPRAARARAGRARAARLGLGGLGLRGLGLGGLGLGGLGSRILRRARWPPASRRGTGRSRARRSRAGRFRAARSRAAAAVSGGVTAGGASGGGVSRDAGERLPRERPPRERLPRGARGRPRSGCGPYSHPLRQHYCFDRDQQCYPVCPIQSAETAIPAETPGMTALLAAIGSARRMRAIATDWHPGRTPLGIPVQPSRDRHPHYAPDPHHRRQYHWSHGSRQGDQAQRPRQHPGRTRRARRRRRRRSRHALTFHRCNVLLNTPRKPRRANRGSPGLLGRGATSLIAWHAEFIPSVRQSHRA